MAIGRMPGAALSRGTISASKMSTSGSGRRRWRGTFLCEGSLESFSMRYAVAVLIDVFAAATAVVWVCRSFTKSLIW